MLHLQRNLRLSAGQKSYDEPAAIERILRIGQHLAKLRQWFPNFNDIEYCCKLEMWANAQRDGRPAGHRWRPRFNAAS